MSVNTKDILASIENLIVKNNSTSSSFDISSGLKKRVQKTWKGISDLHNRLPVANITYPVIFIETGDQSELYSSIGCNRRDIAIGFRVVCVTQYGVGTAYMGDSAENSDLECIQLTQNVANLIRNYPRMSQTSILKTDITSIEYNTNIGEQYYNAVSTINIEIKLLSD